MPEQSTCSLCSGKGSLSRNQSQICAYCKLDSRRSNQSSHKFTIFNPKEQTWDAFYTLSFEGDVKGDQENSYQLGCMSCWCRFRSQLAKFVHVVIVVSDHWPIWLCYKALYRVFSVSEEIKKLFSSLSFVLIIQFLCNLVCAGEPCYMEHQETISGFEEQCRSQVQSTISRHL